MQKSTVHSSNRLKRKIGLGNLNEEAEGENYVG